MPSLSERLLAEAEEESMSRNLYNRGVAVDHDEWLGPDDDFDPYQISNY